MSSVILNSEIWNMFPLKLSTKQEWPAFTILTQCFRSSVSSSYPWTPSYFIHVLITVFHRIGTHGKILFCFVLLGLYFFSLRLGSWLLFGTWFVSFCFSVVYLIPACLCWMWEALSRLSVLSEIVKVNFSVTSITDNCMSHLHAAGLS